MRSIRLLGFLCLVAAPILLLVEYGNLPEASTCAFINQMNNQLGLPSTCSSAMPVRYWVIAAVLAAVGLVLLFTGARNHTTSG